MLKKILKGALIGAGLLALTATAQADVDINIYGASAQYLFWNDAADNMLAAKGCTAISQAARTDGKHGITQGTCPGYGTVRVRYSAKASYDSMYACTGTALPASLGTTGCEPNNRQRQMASSVTTPNTLSCQTVTIGASDVGADIFEGMYSEGQLNGHLGGGYVTREMPNSLPRPTVLGQPVVVPFAFFVNNTALPSMTNLTHTMAGVIFSGTQSLWSDFAGGSGTGGTAQYPNKYVIACLRHAGSGTHATLKSLMPCNGGYSLASVESAPILYFYEGSSQMMRGVYENAGQPTSDFAAIGYADADQCGDSGLCTSGGGARMVAYEGAMPTKSNIANCIYKFWAKQQLFDCADTPDQDYWLANLLAFASDADNMPTGKTAWWPAASEMRCDKATDCSVIVPTSTSGWGF